MDLVGAWIITHLISYNHNVITIVIGDVMVALHLHIRSGSGVDSVCELSCPALLLFWLVFSFNN